jgi:DNA repair protein RadA/Sms
VGLGGELRAVSQIEARLAEAEKMGFKHAVIPKGNRKNLPLDLGLTVHSVSQAQEALDVVLQ